MLGRGRARCVATYLLCYRYSEAAHSTPSALLRQRTPRRVLPRWLDKVQGCMQRTQCLSWTGSTVGSFSGGHASHKGAGLASVITAATSAPGGARRAPLQRGAAAGQPARLPGNPRAAAVPTARADGAGLRRGASCWRTPRSATCSRRMCWSARGATWPRSRAARARTPTAAAPASCGRRSPRSARAMKGFDFQWFTNNSLMVYEYLCVPSAGPAGAAARPAPRGAPDSALLPGGAPAAQARQPGAVRGSACGGDFAAVGACAFWSYGARRSARARGLHGAVHANACRASSRLCLARPARAPPGARPRAGHRAPGRLPRRP